MVNIFVWLVIGGVIGWVASLVMNTDRQQGLFLNVVVGIVGASLGSLVLSPLAGTPTINQDIFSMSALLISVLGSVLLLALVNLFRRGRVR